MWPFREKHQRPLRVKRFIRPDGSSFQVLREKRLGFWWDIDREEVPEAHLIAVGVFGFDDHWKSKFGRYGSFGRDGIIQREVKA